MPTTNRMAPDHPSLPNGHAAQHANAHANAQADGRSDESVPAAPVTGMPPAPIAGAKISARRSRARAASDDAHVSSSGASATPAAAPPVASADRDAGAEAARDSKRRGANRNNAAKRSGNLPPDADHTARKPPSLPAGRENLPPNATSFAEAINGKADLLEVSTRLLNSTDQRIVRGVWEHMLEMRYGNAARVDRGAQQIVIDMPRPRPELAPKDDE